MQLKTKIRWNQNSRHTSSNWKWGSPIGTEISTIQSRTKNLCSRTGIWDLVWTIEILDSTEIVKLVNTGQILNSKYPTANAYAIELVINVVDGKLMDESRTRLLTSISTFCLFIETVSNEKERGKGISEPMLCFGSNMFLKSNEKEHEKGISESMLCFGNNAFSKSNKKEQCFAQINIQEPIRCFANNVTIFGNNSIGPLSRNVGLSLPFHPLHFIFFHSSRVAPKVQKINRSTRNLVFGKMRGGVSKEEVERLA